MRRLHITLTILGALGCGCSADLTLLTAPDCNNMAARSLDCKGLPNDSVNGPFGSSTKPSDAVASNCRSVGTSQTCLNCLATTGCDSIKTGCASACPNGTAAWFTIMTASSPDAGTAGNTCSGVKISQMCNVSQSSPCCYGSTCPTCSYGECTCSGYGQWLTSCSGRVCLSSGDCAPGDMICRTPSTTAPDCYSDISEFQGSCSCSGTSISFQCGSYPVSTCKDLCARGY